MVRNLTAFFLIAATLIACSTNPITGRNQIKLVSEDQLQEMAVSQYRQFLSENRTVSPSADRDAEMVRRVGQRVASAVERYYKEKGLSQVLDGYKWEYNLVNSKDVNAWCMPGERL